MKNKRNIVVEDESIIGMDIRDVLVNLGFEVPALITSGEEAVRVVGETRPDLMLMDIVLPGKIDGIEAAKIIRDRTNIPVVYMTGNVDLATVERARESEPYGYVLKPINTQDLFSTIDTALSRHLLERELRQKSEELEAANEELQAALEELEATNEAIIGSQKEVEEYNRRLIESEERYRGLFDTIKNGVAIYEVKDDGEDFIFKDINRAAERIDGQNRDELVGRSIFEARPGDEKFVLIDLFRRVCKTGVSEGLPLKLYQDERLSGWYENYVYRLPSGEIVAVFDDRTEQKKMEEELLECERRHSTLLGNLPGMPIGVRTTATGRWNS
jgi:CheY-like chemotaxis protein